MVALGEQYKEQGLGTLFITADLPEQRAEALAFLTQQGVTMPGFVKAGRDQAFIAALHPEWTGTLPATILFDASRQRRHFFEGEVTRAVLETAITELLGETPGHEGQ